MPAIQSTSEFSIPTMTCLGFSLLEGLESTLIAIFGAVYKMRTINVQVN